jgi:hypothetical protein
MSVHKELRCPSCGALGATDQSSCQACGALLVPERDAVEVEDVLADVSRLMDELDAGSSPQHTGKGGKRPAATVAPPAPVLAAPSSKKEGTAAKETYQCLICGSTILADAQHCRICGTIFVDESQAKDFHGIPVTKITRSSEIDPEENELRQARRAETLRIAPPVAARGGMHLRPAAAGTPAAESAPAVRPVRVDELPEMESEGTRRPVVKKKIIKRKD